MSENHFDQFEDDAPAYADRRANRTMEWMRTVIVCGVLLGGLVAILPMIPDKDPRGLSGTQGAKPAQISMTADPTQAVMQDVTAVQPMTMIRRSGDMRHRT